MDVDNMKLYDSDAITHFRGNDASGGEAYYYESHGCVTINRDQNNSKEMWNVLNDIMNKTSTKQVKENRGRQWLNPFSKRKWYGTMVVIGND